MFRRVRDASPFQSPAWLLPWWRAFGTAEPRVVVQERDGNLTGILPAYVLGGEDPKVLPIGIGITDYLDALVAPEGDADALLACLLASADGLRCDWTDLPADGHLRRAACPGGWAADLAETDVCPVLSPLSAIPARMRRKLRMNTHRAERAGGIVLETATVGTWPEMLNALVALHEDRWGGGVLNDPCVLGFHRDAAPDLLAAGLLRLNVARHGGRIVAALMALQRHAAIYLYLSGYDRACAAFSPGSLLLEWTLAQAKGCTEAHFLRGDEGYKFAFGALPRRNAARTFTAIP